MPLALANSNCNITHLSRQRSTFECEDSPDGKEEAMEDNHERSDESATLDPPGSIAVVGAGPLGIEAALYGRYLGYDVTLFEAEGVASSLVDRRDEPIPMMPDRCVSPLGRSALGAQRATSNPQASPMLIGEWIDQVWQPLTETDLLRGRLQCPVVVRSMELVAVQEDDSETEEDGTDDDDDDPVPPDFRLTLDDGKTADFEAVILSVGGEGPEIDRRFPDSTEYYFRVGGRASGDAEQGFWSGLKEIVAVYASLGGRADLDLYRPPRG
jgi:hypothetical protein